MSFKRPFRNNPLPNRERENNDPRSSSPIENEDSPDSEQEFIQKLEIYAGQLKQIETGTHPEFIKSSKKLESWLDDQKLRSQILHEHKIDEIHSQYEREVRTCDHDCTLEKKKLQDNLVNLCEDLKRHLEKDKSNIELTATGDVLEMKPTVTRKLRRRVQEMAPNMTGVGFNGNSSKLSYWGEINLYNTNWIVKAKKAKNELPPSPTNREENVIPTMTSFGNLFGSLGVDLDDGKSLLNHFRASLTRNNGHSDSGSHSNGRPSTLLAQSLLASAKPSPVATAVVSGLMGSVNIPPPKRKKPQGVLPQAQLNMLLPQNDIYSDLTLIHRACGKPSASLTTGTSRKHGCEGSASSARNGPASPPLTRGLGGEEGDRHGRRGGDRRGDRYGHPHYGHHHGDETSSTTPRVWIDDGALFIGQNCYRVGSQVCLESHGCNGTVSGVGVQDIQIKRTSDNGIVRINLQQLRLGRYVITPLKPRQ